jgi:alcohol dehydrogenase
MQLPGYFEFMCPVKTGSGNQALEHLPSDLAALDARKPLILTEKRNREKGLVNQLANAFRTWNLTLGVYDGIDETTNLETVRNLYTLYLDRGFDCIIALGNGNVMNVAKILNIAVSGKPEDLKRVKDGEPLTEPLKPLVYIPVISGSATETSGDVCFDGMTVSSRYLMPDIVTIDPRMLADEAPENMANTGLAALTFGIEAYMAGDANPFSMTYAQLTVDFVINNLEKLIGESLVERGRIKTVIREFAAKKERTALVNAACMAGYVYSNTPRGLASILGREVADATGTPEGMVSGLLLPYVMESAVCSGADLSAVMRPMAGIETFCATPEGQRFDYAVNRIRHLQNELFNLTEGRIPRTLDDLKISRKTLADIAEKVGAATGEFDKDLCLMILEHAFDGKPVKP